MIFRNIYIDLNREEFSVDTCYDFLKKSRHLCNFIAREYLAKAKYQTADFSRLVITLGETPKSVAWVNSSKVLCVQLKFIPEEYNNLKKYSDVSEYFISKLELGVKKALESKFDLPDKEISDGIVSFRMQNYVNEWTHKKKLIRPYGIEVKLNCKLTQEHFFLDLLISQKGQVIFQKELLVLDPDEIAFDYRFKDIVIENEKLIISSKVTENLFEIPIEKLFTPLS